MFTSSCLQLTGWSDASAASALQQWLEPGVRECRQMVDGSPGWRPYRCGREIDARFRPARHIRANHVIDVRAGVLIERGVTGFIRSDDVSRQSAGRT
jgi:hypothetical protein